MKKRTNPIWLLSKQELQFLLDSSRSYNQLFDKIGQNLAGGNKRGLLLRINEENLNLDKFKENHKFWRQKPVIYSNEELFQTFCNIPRCTVKKRIIKDKLIPYICQICLNAGSHNNKFLSLDLDHINGINNDNRIENLRFLCPNCHSQHTAEQRKNKRKIKIIKTKKSYFYKPNFLIRKFNPTKEELIKILEEKNYNYVAVGKHFNVSDNAIRRRSKLIGLEIKKKKKSLVPCSIPRGPTKLQS